MATVDEVQQATREVLELGEDESLDYITQELIDAAEQAFLGQEEGNIAVVREDGTPATEEDVGEAPAPAPEDGAAVVTPQATKVYYGNHPWRLGSCFYWLTNGVGQPCGSGFSVKACNWKSVKQEWVQSCSGGFSGYRFTFTY